MKGPHAKENKDDRKTRTQVLKPVRSLSQIMDHDFGNCRVIGYGADLEKIIECRNLNLSGGSIILVNNIKGGRDAITEA